MPGSHYSAWCLAEWYFSSVQKIYGGGWWLGYTRTDPPGFEFIFNYPIRMYDGMVWLLTNDSKPSYPSPDDFELTS
jgi:hypothetical protein